MPYDKTFGDVLVVSGNEKGAAAAAGLLESDGCERLVNAESGAAARRMLVSRSFDLTIVNAPLPDESGQELAMFAAENACTGVVLLVRAENFDEIAARVERAGVMTLSKPVSRALFHQTVRLLAAALGRERRFAQEKRALLDRVDEIRTVARAKCLLVEYLRMSEAQAHKYIEKQAMDLRITRREVAENILKTYDS